jgi:hypothetical protein
MKKYTIIAILAIVCIIAIMFAVNRGTVAKNVIETKGMTKMKNVNGWLQPPNIGRYGTDYDTRAGIAIVGLGADMQEDTIYPTAYVDGDGKLLDSANKYVMHYEKGRLSPTNGTWSVSGYKGNFYERNVLDRYAVAPWMPLRSSSTPMAHWISIYRPSRQARTRRAAGSVQPDDPQLLAEGSGA